MKSEINPVVFWGAIGVVAVGLLLFWVFRARTSSQFETTGSEKQIEQVKKTGKFYTPPAGVPGVAPQGGYAYPAGAPGAAPGGAPGGIPGR